jgi:polygalacturonase
MRPTARHRTLALAAGLALGAGLAAAPALGATTGAAAAAASTVAASTATAGTSAASTPANTTPATGTSATGTPATGTPATSTPATGTSVTGTSATGTSATGTSATGGGYWNQPVYDAVTRTVAQHVPRFPARQCLVTDPRYAGLVRQVVDGQGTSITSTVWYYGDAINAAIAACHAAGGGTVIIPADGSLNGDGVYYSGAITLLSNVDLRVETGATVKFVRNTSNAYYPVVLTSNGGIDLYNYSPPVYALNQHDIALTGGGTLDAQYNVSPWQFPAPIPGAQSGTSTVLSDMNYENLPVDQRIFSDDGHMPAEIPELTGCPPQARDWGPCGSVKYVPPPAGAVAYASTLAPQFVEFNHSADILVAGVHLVNTQFWQIHPLNSRDVLIDGVHVDDTAHLTDDGIDPESCDDVVIENSSITTLDDGVAVKSGKDEDGRDLRAPSENIVIQGNTFYNPSGGSASISIGSEMSGGVWDVLAEDNTSGGAGTAFVLKIKTNSYRGGVVRDIYVRNAVVTQTIRGIVNFDTNYAESGPPPDTDVFNPVIHDIYIDNVNATPSVTTSYPAFVIYSDVSRTPIQNVYYANSVYYTTSTFESAFSATIAKFFENLVIRNVTFINPGTGASTVYNTAPLSLKNDTAANFSGGAGPVRLTAVSLGRPDLVTRLPSDTFTISGQVDLAASPGFLPGGSVAIFVDRDTTPVPVTLNPDGSFTSGPITLNDGQYWYQGRHYIAVNFYNGIDINTTVYQVCSASGCQS